jgi:hypothetical protein
MEWHVRQVIQQTQIFLKLKNFGFFDPRSGELPQTSLAHPKEESPSELFSLWVLDLIPVLEKGMLGIEMVHTGSSGIIVPLAAGAV